MQPLARDDLTADQVTGILQDTANLTVQRGLDVLDLNLNFLYDHSEHFLGGTVTSTSSATIHRTATLTVDADIDYGQQLLRPWMRLTSDAGLSVTFPGGVYLGNAPETDFGDIDIATGGQSPTIAITCQDRLAQINRPVGDAYTVAADVKYKTAILAVFALAGIPASHVLFDGTGAHLTTPISTTWPMLTDPNETNRVPVDAVADSNNATTFLRIINALLAQINYRGVWCDENGYFRCDPYIASAFRGVDWTFDYDDPLLAIIARQRSRTLDLSQVPNQWRFVQSNLTDGSGNPVAPTEGAGQYTVANYNDGLTSIQARGGGVLDATSGLYEGVGVLNSPVQIDAVDQPTLQALGDKQVADDQAVFTTFAASTSPFPAAWHEDIYLYNDAAIGGGRMKVQSTGWTLDYGNSTGPAADMTHTWQQVA